MKLKFGRGNAKLDSLEKLTGKQVWTFSLLSGHSCPYAKDCLSMVVKVDGKLKIQDGPDTQFRCFSASQEALFPAVYAVRENSMAIVEVAGKDVAAAAAIISDSLPKKAGIVRIHVGGDFKTKNYFQAWLMVACANPDRLFYAYTKSIPFWLWAKEQRIIPKNFILTASYGGHRDDLIKPNRLRYAVVVKSEAVAKRRRLEIDHDDSHAALPELAKKSFALLINGVQPAGSEWGKAVRELKGVGSYSKGNK